MSAEPLLAPRGGGSFISSFKLFFIENILCCSLYLSPQSMTDVPWAGKAKQNPKREHNITTVPP
jgi:hypothetical protein